MKNYEKIVIAGVGAITPLLAKIFVDNMNNTPTDEASITASWVVWVGLFLAGGFWAYVNEGNLSKLQIFQLGIAVPSLIISSMNADNLADELKSNADYKERVQQMEIMKVKS